MNLSEATRRLDEPMTAGQTVDRLSFVHHLLTDASMVATNIRRSLPIGTWPHLQARQLEDDLHRSRRQVEYNVRFLEQHGLAARSHTCPLLPENGSEKS